MTDETTEVTTTDARNQVFETRSIDQAMTIGPSLQVTWYIDGTITIEVIGYANHRYDLTNLLHDARENEVTTIVELEPVDHFVR